MCCATVHVICFLVAHSTFNPQIRYCLVVFGPILTYYFMSPFYREKKSQFYYRQSLQSANNLFNVIDPLFRETALFWIQVWPCQKDSRINSRYFKFGGNIRCFASKALEFLRALILRSVTDRYATMKLHYVNNKHSRQEKN